MNHPPAVGWSFIEHIWKFLSHAMEGASDSLQEFGLGSKQMVVLAILELQNTPGQLKMALGAPASSVSNILNELEKKGLIARGVHPTDRRQYIISRTPLGDEMLHRGIAEIETGMKGFNESLSEDEKAAFKVVMKVLERSV